jgi:hypothetical protein
MVCQESARTEDVGGDLDQPVGRPPVEQPPEQRHPPARPRLRLEGGTDQERETERPRGHRTRRGAAGGGERERRRDEQ